MPPAPLPQPRPHPQSANPQLPSPLRQDLAFDGSVPIFVNRLLISEFLHTLVFVPGHSNILEDFLWHSLACVEMVALTRALTLFDLLLSMPLRWLCGKGSELSEWSVYKAGVLLDLTEGLLMKAAEPPGSTPVRAWLRVCTG